MFADKSYRWQAVVGIMVLLTVALFMASCVRGHTGAVGKKFGKEAVRTILLAERGKTDAVIVVAPDAPPATRHAAEELQRFLGEMTGADFPIVPDTDPVRETELIVGHNRHAYTLNISVDYSRLGADGYVLISKGSRILLAGGEPRGTLYAVYGLLEDHLGCRWFTPEVSRIPKAEILTLDPLNEVRIPPLEYREPFVNECFDPDWCARNRMNSSNADLKDIHGGKIIYCGFVHTFNSLLPPEKWFDAHPEYFSLVKGQRLRERTQLCCTNPDVIRLVTEEVKRRMREHPEAKVFSVSQNDWFNYCECENCQALAQAEGTQAAPLLYLVNEVARAVRDEFPDKIIDTLAYQYTRKPPQTMRPEPNVVVRLCSIECDFSHPFEARLTPENKSFCEDLEGWNRLTDRLWIWNYNTSFSHYLVPFPNLQVRGPNIRYLVRHGVTGIFEQDVYNTPHGEFSTLSGYLGAKLLWNPDYDENKAINEFLEGVYGAAAPYLRRYLDLIHDAVADPKTNMVIWIGPTASFITDDLIARADMLFDAAERAVADEPDTLARVRVARMTVDYTAIERQRRSLGMRSAFKLDHRNFAVLVQPELQARIDRFLQTAERSGLTLLGESGPLLADYKNDLLKALPESGRYDAMDAVKGVQPKPGLRCEYYEATFEKLPDFATLTPAAVSVTDQISLAPALRQDGYALRFTGLIRAPRDGVYAFTLRSNDGSRLKIHDKVIVDNDGLHKTESRLGFAALRAGWHPVTVEYFESGGAEDLGLNWAGPEIKDQPVPAKAFGHME